MSLLQNPIVSLFSAVQNIIWPADKKPCYPFLSRLAESGRPMKDLVGNVIGLAVGSSVNYAQGQCRDSTSHLLATGSDADCGLFPFSRGTGCGLLP